MLLLRRLRATVLPLVILFVSGCAAVVESDVNEPVARKNQPQICAQNTVLELPAGFCATVFADGVGYARHLVVRDNGDVYVALIGEEGGIVALRDTNNDGKADREARFGRRGGTGLGIRNGYLYFGMPTRIVRYRFAGDALLPEKNAEVVVDGFNKQRAHASKTIVFDDSNGLLVNVGAPSNACQKPQRSPGVAGQDPCPELDENGGIWRYDADATDQQAFVDGRRYASGIRNALANDWHPRRGQLIAVQHGRDQLSELWPEHFSVAQRVELPAEELLAIEQDDEFGWPYCFYDPFKQRAVLAPEYGGDGDKVGRCAGFKSPLLGFPAHWAPNDLLIYRGRQFPSRYRFGAFVAFHGSWNRSPEPQRGYKVAFVALDDPSEFEVFADGFTQREEVRGPADARYRPTGLAQGPDGALYISESRTGRIWRVTYNTPAVAD
ncbi:MAG: sorbosone dehydrogenase family protein [Gammaproteobacteria bacterium]